MNTKMFLLALLIPFVAYGNDSRPHPIAKFWTIGLETAAMGLALPAGISIAGNVLNKEILKAAGNNPRVRAASMFAGLALSAFNTKYSNTAYCNVVGGDQLLNKLILASSATILVGASKARLDSKNTCDFILSSLRTPVREQRLLGACFLVSVAVYSVKNGLWNISNVFKSKE